MDDGIRSAVTPCRPVTAEEIAHYQEFGWVKLASFVQPDVVRTLLDLARERMGEDGDSNADYGLRQPYFNVEAGCGPASPLIKSLVEGVGRAAKALMHRRSTVGVRYFQDFFAPKLPAKRKTKHEGNGPTAFHQDFVTFGVDRSGGMTFWFPLEAYGPDAGTMSFINRSHRAGVLGNYRNYGNAEDVTGVFPELRELEVSEPMTYAAGDITVHSHLTVHGAGANLMNKPRWAYIMLVQPADACWNGMPVEACGNVPQPTNQQLDDARFPVIA